MPGDSKSPGQLAGRDPTPPKQLGVEGDAAGEARLPPPLKHHSAMQKGQEGKEAENCSHSAGTGTSTQHATLKNLARSSKKLNKKNPKYNFLKLHIYIFLFQRLPC